MAYYIEGDFQPVLLNETTQRFEAVYYDRQTDELKKKLAKNNETKTVLYNALSKKE